MIRQKYMHCAYIVVLCVCMHGVNSYAGATNALINAQKQQQVQQTWKAYTTSIAQFLQLTGQLPPSPQELVGPYMPMSPGEYLMQRVVPYAATLLGGACGAFIGHWVGEKIEHADASEDERRRLFQENQKQRMLKALREQKSVLVSQLRRSASDDSGLQSYVWSFANAYRDVPQDSSGVSCYMHTCKTLADQLYRQASWNISLASGAQCVYEMRDICNSSGCNPDEVFKYMDIDTHPFLSNNFARYNPRYESMHTSFVISCLWHADRHLLGAKLLYQHLAEIRCFEALCRKNSDMHQSTYSQDRGVDDDEVGDASSGKTRMITASNSGAQSDAMSSSCSLSAQRKIQFSRNRSRITAQQSKNSFNNQQGSSLTSVFTSPSFWGTLAGGAIGGYCAYHFSHDMHNAMHSNNTAVALYSSS